MGKLTQGAVNKLNTNKGLKALLTNNPFNLERAVRTVDYQRKLEKLQVELIRLQTWGINNDERIIIIFEGRDAAGKGGAIRRMTERINPRHMRIVALPKPNEDQKTQWYFQRYVEQFPKAGEIVFFDRSWYNRAVVEPVNGFCTQKEYQIFMNQVNEFERMILESGIRLVKVYMSINKREQAKRFKEIVNNPLKQWKITPVDLKAQELWDDYTDYKRAMFSKTNTAISPWKVIRANRKTIARINVINHVLKSIPYDKNTVV
ncbi:polyphosphate kinase 2 [Tenacibaculum piscium]|uniref:ADP/GDP-polyphosphate phosphotransferase n=1 Tax=Tenacibaculum piscium TaxID=1458515 RepID=A0A2H1YFV2_9FLAO|nr:polyphosphate kinase 2 [Tenacibaculum piscium]MBE7629726.1 polyphosphate kinase 2 [Tenacibaculum piscium]MBE7671519.1 polyphosphate kinase 2 [Tenacibaculum piscium]MBE7690642.1 polyphosphate kinase 2 [Tenacibaculum piscium]SOS74358.1 Polyphosphate kinase [Tenacibaculum piscium]